MMKKLFFILCILFVAGNAYANRAIEEVTPTISGTQVESYVLASAKYTDATIMEENVGFCSISMDVTTGSDIDVSFQVSNDGTTWWTPVDTDGTSLGAIYTAVTSDKWIVFTPRMAKYMRFYLDPDASSVLSMRLIYLKDET